MSVPNTPSQAQNDSRYATPAQITTALSTQATSNDAKYAPITTPGLPGQGVVYRVYKTNGTWPSRPSGATYVEWVGPGNPDPPYTTAGDSWLDTTP